MGYLKADSVRGKQVLPERIVQQDFLEKIMVLLSLERLVGIDWQPKIERRSLPSIALGFDFTAMMVDDKVTSHQVDAIFHGAVGAHHKRIENQTQRFLGQAGAVIANLHVRLGLLIG